MTTFPFRINLSIPQLFGQQEFNLNFYDGLTMLVGPNGAGKSQVLRALKDGGHFNQYSNGRKVRLITAGRLSPIENFRTNVTGWSGVNYENAQFGGTDYRNNRHNSEAVSGDFHTLSVRADIKIKVSERLSTIFNRKLYIDWDAGNLKINFSSLDGSPYSAAREASGILHLASILAALYDDEVGILLIDEPEISLHPQFQAFLLNEIKAVAGNPQNSSKKIVILATHSTEFLDVISPRDLSRVVFFTTTKDKPKQIDPNTGELNNRKVKELLTRIGQAHKSAFFSSKPLLVEGPSDTIVCNALNRHMNLFLEAGGSQLVPVIGKGEFPAVVKMFRLIGKSPVILADLDALTDDITFVDIFNNANNQLIERVNEMGHRDLISFSRQIYQDFNSITDEYWESFSSVAEQHRYWINREGNDERKAKKRAGMATILTTPNESIVLWDNGSIILGFKTRLVALLDILELAGCFILRKGTIENYYNFADDTRNYGKPSAAIEEIEELLKQENTFINEKYSDILRALKFAASIKDINEGKAIADLLLAVISPALNRINEINSDSEFNTLVRSIVNDASTLFHLSKVQIQGEDAIQVDLASNILSINGFPIIFPKNCNPVEVTSRALNLAH
jgi:predicted ATPase